MPESPPANSAMMGICQWFHYEDHEAVEDSVRLMHELGATQLRTGISWADFHRPGGEAWYRWQMDQLADFDVLLSVWHTPPSIAEGGVCASPPRRLADYAAFLDQVIDLYGDRFTHLELWNEPNNRYKWDFQQFDPQWEKFGEMIRLAARAARRRDVPTVLGGMIPVDPHWLELMRCYGALEDVEIVAIHGFPEMWWPDHPNWDWKDHWNGWPEKVERIADAAGGRPIWITETGLATWELPDHRRGRYELQAEMLRQAALAPVQRVYWYCLVDLDPQREAIEGFHVDENEYHLGLVHRDGRPKPAWNAMRQVIQTG